MTAPALPVRRARARVVDVVQRVVDGLTGLVHRLPPPVPRLVPREMVGFALLALFTFGVDVALLALLEGAAPLPLPASVAIAYGAAFSLNFVLNRTLNFRSHAPVGPQVLRFALVIACDFAITVGVTTAFTGLGVDFRLARVIAGGCVAAFTYSACRWWVFRDVLADQRNRRPSSRR